MDAQYDFRIRQQHQQSTFHGPARQFGSGGMGAFAMRMGRVAMPLMKKYVLPVAKEFGKNLVSSFVPEFANIISGKKRPRKAVQDVLKHSANRTFAKATGNRGAGAVAGAGGEPGRCAKRCERADGRATPARKKSVKDGNKSSAGNPSVAKEVIVKKSPAKRSRSDILSKINFSRRKEAPATSTMAASNNIATAVFNRSTEIANPVTHSALDFFERPSVLIIYERSIDQEVSPHVGCRGPQLDVFVTAGSKNCIDLNRICLAIELCLYQPDGTEKIKPADVDLTFANNTLHSLFSHAEMFLNGKLNSSSNNNYNHLAFIETELTTDIASKNLRGPSVKVISTEQTPRETKK